MLSSPYVNLALYAVLFVCGLFCLYSGARAIRAAAVPPGDWYKQPYIRMGCGCILGGLLFLASYFQQGSIPFLLCTGSGIVGVLCVFSGVAGFAQERREERTQTDQSRESEHPD